MKPPKELTHLINESEITTGPEADERILRDARNELAKRWQDRIVPPDAVLWRALMKSKTTKFATVAVIVIAILIVFQFVGNPVGSNLTFAHVIEPILNADTAMYDIIVGDEDGDALVIHEEVMGSRIRVTIEGDDKVVSIADLKEWRTLVLYEEKMEAQYTSAEGLPAIPNYLEVLKNTIITLKNRLDFTVEELGFKQLDGHDVVGFYAYHQKQKMEVTIWADVDTGLPVRIEHNQGQLRSIMKNMEFDIPMEENLFSMEIPAGYKLLGEMTVDIQGGTEDRFIEGLRMLAEAFNEGQFPVSVAVEDILKLRPDSMNQFEAMNLSEQEKTTIRLKLQYFLLFIVNLPGEGEWTYRGQGIMLGEAETPIFWYRPEESETYRVIYGDLHVENVAPDSLPLKTR